MSDQWHGKYRTGCLPRTTRPGETCPLFSSRVKVIPRGEWEERARKITLRPLVHDIYNQGQVGSCASEAKDQCVAISRAFAGLSNVLFNPYGTYHFVNGGQDRGSTIDANLNFGRQYGSFPESVWSRSKGWRARPDEQAMEAAKQHRILEYYDILTVDEFATALLLAFPVEPGAKGHAVAAVSHLHRRNAPEIVNSWGPNWEDSGFGVWATYAEFANMLRYGVYAIRTVTQDQSLFLPEPVV